MREIYRSLLKFQNEPRMTMMDFVSTGFFGHMLLSHFEWKAILMFIMSLVAGGVFYTLWRHELRREAEEQYEEYVERQPIFNKLKNVGEDDA